MRAEKREYRSANREGVQVEKREKRRASREEVQVEKERVEGCELRRSAAGERESRERVRVDKRE